MAKGRAELSAVLCDRCGVELLTGSLVSLSVYCRRCRRWSEQPAKRVSRTVEVASSTSKPKSTRATKRRKR
jgi:hypothetical protein